MKKVFVSSDVHDDVEALEKFVDYSQSQSPDEMWILGDLSLRPYDIESANQLLESKDVQKFISAKRDYNERILKSMKRLYINLI